jgi:hypothetical protein
VSPLHDRVHQVFQSNKCKKAVSSANAAGLIDGLGVWGFPSRLTELGAITSAFSSFQTQAHFNFWVS